MKFDKEKMRDARELAGLTQEQLAKKLGVSKQAVQKWESGAAEPRPAKIKELQAALHTQIASFGDVVLSVVNSYRVPLLGSAAALGIKQSNIPLAEYAAQNADDFVSLPDAKPGDFALTASGDSMAPWYPSGTTLLVRRTLIPRDGERVVAVLDDGDVVFKIYVSGEKRFALCSINSTGKTFFFDKSDADKVRAFFSVVASYRNEADLDAAMASAGIRHYWEKVKEELK